MVIRDPIHGDIVLDETAARIIDTPAFQRLRGIKQLGSASLVYPSCVHTRFEHSLGVYEMARQIVQSLVRRGCRVEADWQRAIPLAALLHDIAHIPFGHTLEDESGLFARHDTGERMEYFLEGAIDRILRDSGMRSLVRAALGLDSPDPSHAWAHEVVSGTVDADMLDYLRRDAFFAGLKQNYDDRVIDSFTVSGGHLAIMMMKDGRDRPDVRSEFFHLLHMRYFLTERVYYHHAKVISSAMVARAVARALESGWTEEDLLWHSDDTLLYALASRHAKDSQSDKLIARVRQRRLLKRGVVLSEKQAGTGGKERLVAAFFQKPEACQRLEKKIAARLGCDPDEVIVYCQAPTHMKDISVRCVTSRGVQFLKEAMGHFQLEIDLLLGRYNDLWRFYVLVPGVYRNACADLSDPDVLLSLGIG
jgi:HD superfamily phosphohydrolase